MREPKKFIFVLMPFDESFLDIYTYGIKQTCEELNVYCERVDEQIFHERILDRIYNQISKSDLVIADMTSRNPNVFYEVGYAHGLGKNVILLTQNADDIPFDLKHFPHIIYNGKIKDLSKNLKAKIDWFLNQSDQNKVDHNFGLEFLLNGKVIKEGAKIPLQEVKMTDRYHSIRIDIFNDSLHLFKHKFRIGLEVNEKFEAYLRNSDNIKTENQSTIITSENIENIYPKSYTSIVLYLNRVGGKEGEPNEVDIKLKVFTPFELKEIPFKLIVPYNVHDAYYN